MRDEDDLEGDELDAFADEGDVAAPPTTGERPLHLDEHGRPRVIERFIEVEPDFHGWRLDLFLRRKIPRLSRTRIQGLIEDWLEVPPGRAKKPHSPVRGGDVLILRRHARPEPPCPRTFDVVLEGQDFLVVDKPALLPVHASARYYFGTLTRLLDERFPGQELQIAHRLDRETSGCLVVARGRVAAARLKGAFGERRVKKTYEALVHGQPDWSEEGLLVDLPLRLAPKHISALNVRMIPVGKDDPDGLPSQTRFRVLERFAGGALVECRPITGRQHQIRAHLAAVGFPIVGDKLYAHGDEAFRRYCARSQTISDAEVIAEFGLTRQALHAAGIEFPDPVSGETVVARAPLAADLRRYIDERSELV